MSENQTSFEFKLGLMTPQLQFELFSRVWLVWNQIQNFISSILFSSIVYEPYDMKNQVLCGSAFIVISDIGVEVLW